MQIDSVGLGLLTSTYELHVQRTFLFLTFITLLNRVIVSKVDVNNPNNNNNYCCYIFYCF